MTSTDALRLATLQASVFTPNLAEFKKPLFLASILSSHSDRYNGDVESLPIPVGLTELPAIEITSDDSQWKLKAGASRMDSHWIRPTASPGVDKRVILNEAVAPLLHYLKQRTIQVGRLALVIHRFAVVENPQQRLIELFCKPDTWDEGSSSAPFRHSRNFEIHNHKTYCLASTFEVNSWVRCQTGTAIDQPAVLVAQDMNTLKEQQHERAFTPEQVEAFFQAAVIEADKILDIYFPDGISQ